MRILTSDDAIRHRRAPTNPARWRCHKASADRIDPSADVVPHLQPTSAVDATTTSHHHLRDAVGKTTRLATIERRQRHSSSVATSAFRAASKHCRHCCCCSSQLPRGNCRQSAAKRSWPFVDVAWPADVARRRDCLANPTRRPIPTTTTRSPPTSCICGESEQECVPIA